MKVAIFLTLCSAISSGCATEHRALISSGHDVANVVKAMGLADHYNMASDLDPSEHDGETSCQSSHLGTFRRFVSDSGFGQGKYDIPEPLAGDLAWFAREFNRSPLMPFGLVIGHTNSDGHVSYNQALSEKRAAEVYRFLVSQGIPGNRLQKFGVGETSPLNHLDSAQARFLNRRVEIVMFIPFSANKGQSHCLPTLAPTGSKANMESFQ